MTDEFRVFIELDGKYRPLPRRYSDMGAAAIIAQTLEGITDCKTRVGARLPVESDMLAGCIVDTVEVDESEGEE